MRYWEDLRVDEVWRVGRHELSQNEIVAFRERFTPLATVFTQAEGSDIRDAAPGYLLCCLGMRMLVDHLLADMASLGSPGVDRIDWPVPAFAGDVLSLAAVLQSMRVLKSRPEMGLIKQRIAVVNQRGTEVARMWTNALIARRE